MSTFEDSRTRNEYEGRQAWLRRTRCLSKIPFSTKKEAEKFLDRKVEQHGVIKTPYFCLYCHRYHIGSSRFRNAEEVSRNEEQRVREWCAGCKNTGNHLLLTDESYYVYANLLGWKGTYAARRAKGR